MDPRADAPLALDAAYRAALARRLAALDEAGRARLAPRLRAGLVPAPAARSEATRPPPSTALAGLLRSLQGRADAKESAEARAAWARLSVQRELDRSRAARPGQAGPLNSQALALRTLDTLEALAPAYLDALVAQLEALRWLEDARPRRA